MREEILREFPTLYDLIGAGGGTACGVTCELCGKSHPPQHDEDCYYGQTGAGNCFCDTAYTLLCINGMQVVNECCGAKIMEIIATLMPAIAENIGPLLKKFSAKIVRTAKSMGSGEVWCVFRKRGGPTMLGIFVGIDSTNGVPILLILGLDDKLHLFSPVTDVFFHHFNQRENAIAFYKEVEKKSA